MTFGQKVRLFFSPIKENKGLFLLLFIFSVLIGFINVYFIVFLEHIAVAIEAGNYETMKLRCRAFVGLAACYFLLRTFLKPYLFKVLSNTYYFLEKTYLKKYLELDNNDAEKIGTGRFISIMGKGFTFWADELMIVFWDKTIISVGIIVALFHVAKASTEMFLFFLIVLVLSFPWVRYFGNKAMKRRKRAKEIGVENDRMFVRWLMSKFEILQQSKFSYEVVKRSENWDRWFSNKFREKIWQGLSYDTIVFAVDLSIVGMAFIIGRGIIQNTGFVFSDYVLLTGLGTVLSRNIYLILQQARRFADSFVHIEKVRNTFDGLGTIQGYETGDTFVYKAGGISLKNITYSYGDKYVFQNFSLEILPGKKTAFVGLSGAGKTTLIKLIAGYLQTQSGTIIVDGQALSAVALKSYYQSVGYLTQEPSVFDGTIKENLMYSLPSDVSIESIKEKVTYALSMAKCDFVYDLPHGINTEIGERGVRLSGGQKQRLAIAKIFLKDPKIIILDEPTSALDSFSEEAITEAMHNLYAGRTVLIIAHRLQTVKEADEIVVLNYNEKAQSSEVIEHGTHDELVSKEGFYAKMLEVQTGF